MYYAGQGLPSTNSLAGSGRLDTRSRIRFIVAIGQGHNHRRLGLFFLRPDWTAPRSCGYWLAGGEAAWACFECVGVQPERSLHLLTHSSPVEVARS